MNYTVDGVTGEDVVGGTPRTEMHAVGFSPIVLVWIVAK